MTIITEMTTIMTNQREMRANNFGGFQEKLSEYRFVYDKTVFQTELIFVLVLGLIVIAIGLASGKGKFTESIPALFFASVTFLFLFNVLFYFFRPGIIINQRGIIRTGFPNLGERYRLIMTRKLAMRLPRTCIWGEFTQIRLEIMFGRTQRHILFVDRFDRQYFLPVTMFGRIKYVGIGHSLSLEGAIEQFVGSIYNALPDGDFHHKGV
ncbi:MAG: hypothetical protein FWH15_07055 [Betaproteobacteria bacterium]|nr:hypothetical protein [Betaproteobacteria bacterium]